jgi:hypothetical protein
MHRSPFTVRRIPVLNLILLVGALLFITMVGVRLADASNPLTSDSNEVRAAWQQAERIGEYEYRSDVTQTTTPMLTLANVGRAPTTERVYVEGTVDRGEDEMQLKMWSEDGTVIQGAGAIELKVEDGQAQGRVNGGEWQPVEGATDIFAPGQDPLGFLHAARDVNELGTETRTLPSGTVTFTRYTFTLDGPTFARQMRDAMEADLARRGELPIGTRLDIPPVYAEMTGSGEIWIATDDLPLRLSLDLTFPPGEAEQVTALLISDFYNWGELSGVAAWLLPLKAALSPSHSAPLALQAFILLTFAGMTVLMMRYRASRKLYGAVVSAMILSMVSGPLMQTQQAYAFSQRLNTQQAIQQAEHEAQQAAEARMAAQTENTWEPHQNPLTGVNAPRLQAEDTETQETQTYVDDGADTDGDGLTDVQERIIRSDPNVADTDGDRLIDGLEVLELGTTASDRQQIDTNGDGALEWVDLGADTDGDGLNDGLEVVGFTFVGQQWYLNPLDLDTNGDNIPDGSECNASTETTIACGDTDGDQTPDVFDLDDDNDGVTDALDLDATAMVGDRTNGLTDNIFQFGFYDLTPDAPVLVDFQLRPTNPDHLWYSLNVLDWPTDDRSGQIQRVFTDTFGDTGELTDGDMRLVPMLEIEIPYVDGGYGNLPTLTPTPVITPAAPLEDWLDQPQLGNFGISVRRLDDTGTLLAYVPLTLVREADGNNPLAFSARMFYRPKDRTTDGIADWGDLQHARLLWMVEVLTDECTKMPDDYETDLEEAERQAKWCEDDANWVSSGSSIQHVYEDAWYLTGLQVREDQGMQVAVAFQDPSYTQSYYTDLNAFHEGNLWSLAQGLEYSFLAGAGDDNGDRTITVDTIAQRWDKRQNSTVPAEQRWNIPQDALVVERYDYEHQGLIPTLAMTNTPELLEAFFTPVVSAGTPMSPTVLFAHEEHFRALSLVHQDYIQPNNGATWQNGVLQGNSLIMTVTEEAAPSIVRAGVKWSPFRYDSDTEKWETYPLDEYWEVYEDRWSATLDDELTDLDDLLGGTTLISAYYLTLAHGLETLVELAGQAAEAAYQRGDTELVNTLSQDGTDLSALDSILDIQMISFSSVEAAKRALNAVLNAVMSGDEFNITTVQLDLGDIGKALNSDIETFIGQREWAWLSDLDGLDPNTSTSQTLPSVTVGAHAPWLKQAYTFASGMAKLNDTLSVAGTALALAWIAYDLSEDSNQGRHWQIEMIFNSVNLALATVNMVAATSGLVLVVGLQTVRTDTTLMALKNVFAAARMETVSILKSPSAIIGLVIAVSAAMGFFIYQVVSEGIAFASLTFNKALAAAVATIIVAVILLVIAAIPVVGPFISALIGILDALILLICSATDTSGEDVFVCYGIAGMLVKVVEWAIYDQTPLLDMSNTERLNLTNFDVSIVDPDFGFTQGTRIDVTLDVDTALYADEFGWGDASPFMVYRWQFADTFLKQSTFTYALQSGTQSSLHEELSLNDMRDTWQEPDGTGWGADADLVTRTEDVQGQATYVDSGINAAATDFYLAEGYAMPVQECAMIPIPYGPIIVPTPVCWLRSYKDTSFMNAGGTLGFDIFPSTLDGFYELTEWDGGYFLAWDADFPVQRDADGDNLISRAHGGPDPNDSLPDADGDSLSDYVELAIGSDPMQVDTDGDHLTDYQEALAGTAPRQLDTDRDGLKDGEEAYHPDWLDSDGDNNTAEWVGGWEIVYTFDGDTPVRTHVWSNPLRANEDNDDYLDAQEFAYRLHPQVRSTSNLLDLTSTIQGSNVVRPSANVAYEVSLTNNLKGRAMEGLLGVDFPPAVQNPAINPQNFQLLPRQGITLTGQVTVAPSIGASQAVSLTNIAGAVPTDLTDQIAGRTLWLHLDETSGTTFVDASLRGHNAACQGGSCPQLNQTGYRQRAILFDGVNDQVAVNATVAELGLSTGSYTILAWVLTNSNSDNNKTIFRTTNGSIELSLDQGGHPTLYVNGVRRAIPNNASTTFGNWHRVALRYHAGTYIYTIFLDGLQVAAFDGTSVQPNWGANETATIGGPSFLDGKIDEVEVFPYALSDTDIASRARGSQVFYFDFGQVPSRTQSWVDNSAYNNRVACELPGSGWNCPNGADDGVIGDGYRFAPANPAETTLLRVGTPGSSPNLNLSRGNGSFSVAVWARPAEGRGTVMEYPHLVTDRGSPGDAASIEIQFGPGSSRCTYTFQMAPVTSGPGRLEGWHHIGVTFDGTTLRGYLDGQSIGTSTSCSGKRPESKDNFLIGSDNTTNQQAAPNGSGYAGWMDELRLYDYALTPGQIDDLYWVSLPSVELRFDEAPGRTTVRDSSLAGITGTCATTACPVTGVPGRINQSALFDGVDDAIQIGTSAQLGMVGRSFAVSTWIRADGTGTRPILGMNSAAGTATFALGLNNNVPYVTMGNTSINASSALPIGTWHHLVWRYEYDTANNIKRGDLYVNGSVVASNINLNPLTGGTELIYAGRHIGSYFLGLLDHIQIFRHALTTLQRGALAAQAPLINLHMDTRVPAVSLYNRDELTNPRANAGSVSYNPTCSSTGCPQAGTTGRVYQSLLFDGQEDTLTVPSAISLTGSQAVGDTFSMGMWVKPTQQKTDWQTLIAVEGANQIYRTRVGLYLKPDSMTLRYDMSCGTQGNVSLNTPPDGQDVGRLFENRWNHVMMTYDDSNVVIYINGLKVLTSPRSTTLFCYAAQPRLGYSPYTGYTHFAGEMDEVLFYRQPLSEDDVRELYTYQGNWVDVAYGHNIIVDADLPRLEFSEPGYRRTDQPAILGISAWDATSEIASASYEVHQTGNVVETGALQKEGALWLFSYQPLSGEQEITVRVTDQAGNQRTRGRQLIGDSEVPVVQIETDLNGPLDVEYNEYNETWQLDLRGRVRQGDADTNSPNESLTVTILDERSVPVGEPQTFTFGEERWNILYPFPTRPNGTYTLHIEATDEVGNVGTLNHTISIDGTPPEADIAFPSETRTALQSGQVVTGTVSEDGAASGVRSVEASLVPSGWDHHSSATWLTTGLRWHLPLDESRTDTAGNPTEQFHDATGRGNDATCAGESCPTIAVSGIYANAVLFNGDGLVTAPILETLSAFTVGTWVNPGVNTTGDQPFLAFTDEAGTAVLTLAFDPATRHFIVRDGSGATTGTAIATPDGWHHLMVAVQEDGTSTLFVNGQEDATFTTTARPTANGTIRLGGDGAAFFMGQVDDVVLYNTTLSLTDVRRHWRGYGAVLRLGFDEHTMPDGVALPDDSRYEHASILHLNNEAQRFAELGIVGAGALLLKGANEYIEVPEHAALDLSDEAFTQMAWVSIPTFAAGSAFPIFSDATDQSASRFPALEVVDNGSLRAAFGGLEHVTQPLLTANAWNFVATTFDGTTYRFYVNGVFGEETNAFAGAQIPSEARQFTIGRGFSSRTAYAQATLDEVNLFRQSLTADEITAHYQQRWQPATLDAAPDVAMLPVQPSAATAPVQWSYVMPQGLNGSFEIRLRASDLNDNVSFGAQDNERWSGLVTSAPAAATLAGFVALSHGDAIHVVWETTSEVDNWGFNLVRATSPDAESATLLNDELIASEAPGSTEGASYEWIDSAVEPSTTYYYWLETVSTTGDVARHGPVNATVQVPTSITLGALHASPAQPLLWGLAALVCLALAGVLWRRQR